MPRLRDKDNKRGAGLLSNYGGPGGAGRTLHPSDQMFKEHDQAYGNIQDENPYLTYNDADATLTANLRKRRRESVGIREKIINVGADAYFSAKKRFAPHSKKHRVSDTWFGTIATAFRKLEIRHRDRRQGRLDKLTINSLLRLKWIQAAKHNQYLQLLPQQAEAQRHPLDRRKHQLFQLNQHMGLRTHIRLYYRITGGFQ